MANKSSSDKFFVQSINRALTIVDEISKKNERGISMSELAGKLDLPISTVYRIIQNLISWQYVAEKEDGNYVLGLAFLTLGNMVKENIYLRNFAKKYLEELNHETKETIYLAMLDQQRGEIVYIDKMQSLRNITLVAGVGSRNYIHSTANGKCLISDLSDEKIISLLSIKGMPRLTENTITDLATFIKEIEKVRKSGYASDLLENETGVCCVAAPIYDYRRKVVAAVSISGVESNMDKATIEETYVPLVRKYALKISQRMGYDPE